MIKQSTKRLISTFLAILFVVFSLVLFLDYIRPAYEEALKVKGDQLSRKSFVENQLAAITQVTNLIDEFKEEESVQQLISLALPLEPQTAPILSQINVLALNNALVPQSFSLSSSGAQPAPKRGGTNQKSFIKPLAVVTIKVKAIGSYEDFKRFLRSLETSIRLQDVKAIAMKQAGKPTQNLYEFDVTVDAYYQTQ